RARASDWDPICGSHHGQWPKRLQQQAEYMTAPDHSRKRQIPLAPRAPSIHGTQRHSAGSPRAGPLLGGGRGSTSLPMLWLCGSGVTDMGTCLLSARNQETHRILLQTATFALGCFARTRRAVIV